MRVHPPHADVNVCQPVAGALVLRYHAPVEVLIYAEPTGTSKPSLVGVRVPQWMPRSVVPNVIGLVVNLNAGMESIVADMRM